MASHSSTLTQKIPWMEEPGRLQSMGQLQVRRYKSDVTERLHFHFSLFTFTQWRRQWQPTPVLLPGESQGRQSLVGCRLQGRTELDTTEATQQQQQQSLALAQCLISGKNTHKYFVINKWQPLLRVLILNKNKLAWTAPNRYLTESTGLKKVRHKHFTASVPQAACSAILSQNTLNV